MGRINKYIFRILAGQKIQQGFSENQTGFVGVESSDRQFKVPLGFLLVLFLIFNSSCRKLVSVPEPINSITTQEVFATDEQANSAMAGVYANMNQSSGLTFANGAITTYCGLSADEVINFSGSNGIIQYQFYDNDLLSTNNSVVSLWSQPYFNIYQSNAIIAGVANSGGLDDSTKNELTGESLFVRAFCYFYLTNLYGAVPLVLTTNYNKTSLLARSDTAAIYTQIVSDLTQAISLLKTDYSYILAGGERIIPNKWTAMALLARVYLFRGDWANAYKYSNSVIGNTAEYNIVPQLQNVFASNSTEAIWQLKQNTSIASYNATEEGYQFVTIPGNKPNFYISKSLLSAFEPGDQRFQAWLDSTSYNGKVYYFPYKYIIGAAKATVGGTAPQYYMVFRLSEQYLIRAECEAQGEGGGLTLAASDINVIRNRAGLGSISSSTSTAILQAIMQERRIELFAEWGNRWLDLKRWNNAPSVLTESKGVSVTQNALLYPIPSSELSVDPNLVQNPGYN